ncbi:TetR/AcrR family transcriptional regulator [Echinimonas agarilytica]|uniref:TetR/AcrR family transcriptional regulator n=1 Tax=Echinimonas agarilytica TaxID=1215918 RepID=A0AA41W847_9GAMM|nr:TetR/AcrR family transcriptional regulator [Echinimonas agarilytica]MCM2680252.1 TetR/AcrR family transcriptional regulator [Echinimonas agarilytica]
MARTKSFDPEEKLADAMNLFWRKGFNATSLEDLERELKLKRFSIYNAFGDKLQLYRDALQLYISTVFEPAIKGLSETGGLDSIQGFFEGCLDFYATQPQRLGCFICNSSIELGFSDDKVSRLTADAHEQLQKAFFNALMIEKQRGGLSDAVDLDSASRFLVTLYRGLVTSNCIEITTSWMDAYKDQLDLLTTTWRKL